MHRSNFIDTIARSFNQPLLIGIPCFGPLNNLPSNISTFSSNIQAQPIQYTLNEISLIMLNPLPTLIKPSVDLVLNYSFPRLERRPRNIQGLSGEAINDQTTCINGIIKLYLFKSPKMRFRIGIEDAEFTESFEVDTLIAFLTGFDPVISIK